MRGGEGGGEEPCAQGGGTYVDEQALFSFSPKTEQCQSSLHAHTLGSLVDEKYIWRKRVEKQTVGRDGRRCI